MSSWLDYISRSVRTTKVSRASSSSLLIFGNDDFGGINTSLAPGALTGTPLCERQVFRGIHRVNIARQACLVGAPRYRIRFIQIASSA